MISLFKKKVADVTVAPLGQLRYFKDRQDEYWEVVQNPVDTRNSVELEFGAVSGSRDGPNKAAVAAFSEKMKNPEALWSLIDDRFIQLVADEIDGISIGLARDHLYIRSLTVENDEQLEVGFHARAKDIFIELFVENGVVTNIERDDGCCAV